VKHRSKDRSKDRCRRTALLEKLDQTKFAFLSLEKDIEGSIPDDNHAHPSSHWATMPMVRTEFGDGCMGFANEAERWNEKGEGDGGQASFEAPGEGPADDPQRGSG